MRSRLRSTWPISGSIWQAATRTLMGWPSASLSRRTMAPELSRRRRWDPRQLGERRRPTTAEQAVPWLVGAVLALAGIVIVLLALIFSDANGGFAAATVQPTPGLFVPSESTAPSPSASASPSLSPSP